MTPFAAASRLNRYWGTTKLEQSKNKGTLMACQITSTMVSGEVIIGLPERLCFLEHRVRDQIQKLLAEGNRHFILDLSNLSYVDSFGLGQLISIRGAIQEARGTLKLLRPQRYVRQLLQITKLDTVFEIVVWP